MGFDWKGLPKFSYCTYTLFEHHDMFLLKDHKKTHSFWFAFVNVTYLCTIVGKFSEQSNTYTTTEMLNLYISSGTIVPLSMDWAGFECCHVLKRYWSSSKINTCSEEMQNSYIWNSELLLCQIHPQSPITSPHCQEIECENFDFVLLLPSSFFFLSRSSSITHKVYSIYQWFTHQTNALLSGIFFLG